MPVPIVGILVLAIVLDLILELHSCAA